MPNDKSVTVKQPPAPKPKRRRKIKWFPLLLVLLVVGFIGWRVFGPKKVVHPTVETAKVEVTNIATTVSASGTLQAFTVVDVKSKAGGTVLRMAVEEGTLVKQGQLICVIDKQDTTAAYQQAVADVETARSALRQAEQNYRLQTAGLSPKITQSVKGVEAAQARKTQSQQELVVQKDSTRIAVEEAQSAVRAAQANYERVLEEAKVQPQLSQASINQAQANVEAAQAGLESARETLNLLQASTQPQEAENAKAEVAQAKSDLETAQTDLKRQEGLLAKGYVAQSVVDTARNLVVTKTSALRTAQTRVNTLQDGQSAAIREQNARVAQAQGSLSQARAALASARSNAVQDRLKQKEVASSRASLEQARAGLRSAQANRRQVAIKEQDVKSSTASAEQAQASLREVQTGSITNRVRLEDITQAKAKLQRAEITAANAKTNLDQTTVVAPRDGIILQKYVDEGTIIQSGQSGFSGGTSIVQLANVSRMYVNVKVDEADIAQIKPGQPVNIELDAYPDKKKRGTVRKVYPLAVTESNVTYVRAQVEVSPRDVDQTLRPEMNATCDFIIKEAKNAVSIPVEALHEDGGKTSVTVVKDPKKPLWEKTNQESRPVKVGVMGDEAVQITSGLKAGDMVITKIEDPAEKAAAASGGMGMMGGRRR